MEVTFSKAGAVKNIAEGSMEGVKIGDKDILIVNMGGTFYALGNVCTHMGCRLSSGSLEGGQVRCRCHRSVFDVKTGEVVHGPAKTPERVYEVKTENGDLLVDV